MHDEYSWAHSYADQFPKSDMQGGVDASCQTDVCGNASCKQMRAETHLANWCMWEYILPSNAYRIASHEQIHCQQMCLETHITNRLGWEFRFLVLISGTPIRSGIQFRFQFQRFQSEFFFQIKIWNSKINKSRNSIHLILQITSMVIGQPVGLAIPNHIDIDMIPGKGNYCT